MMILDLVTWEKAVAFRTAELGVFRLARTLWAVCKRPS